LTRRSSSRSRSSSSNSSSSGGGIGAGVGQTGARGLPAVASLVVERAAAGRGGGGQSERGRGRGGKENNETSWSYFYAAASVRAWWHAACNLCVFGACTWLLSCCGLRCRLDLAILMGRTLRDMFLFLSRIRTLQRLCTYYICCFEKASPSPVKCAHALVEVEKHDASGGNGRPKPQKATGK